jgi:hypothetical protein
MSAPTSRVSRLGEPEQTALGLLDDRHAAVLLHQPGLIRITSEILTERNQLAAHIRVIGRISVILGIDDRDITGSKLGQIFRTADMLKVAVLLEIVLQGDRADYLAGLERLENRLIQPLLHGNVKMVWAQNIADPC